MTRRRPLPRLPTGVRLLGSCWRPLALGTLAMMAVGSLTLLLAGHVGAALSSLPALDPSRWLPVAGLLAARTALALAGTALLGYTANEFSTALRLALLRRSLNAPLAFHDARFSANLVSVFVADIGMAQELLRVVLPALAQHVPTILVAWVVLLVVDPHLALGLAALGAPTVLGIALLGRGIRRTTLAAQETVGQLAVVASESVSGIRTLKALGGQHFMIERFTRLTRQLDTWRRRRTVLNALLDGLAPAGIIIVAIAGVFLVHAELAAGRLTTSALLTFASFAAVLGASLFAVVRAYAGLEPVIGAMRRVIALLDAADDEPTAGQPFQRGAGCLTLDRVSFRYPNGGGIREVSLTLAPGEVVALVGPNGAGKSTLVSLLLRFYPPDEGRILLDGQEAREIALAEWRRQFALVTRDPALFAVSIAENIALGRPGATEAEVRAAAEAMRLDALIDRLPAGLHAHVGENGVQLSAGQRQRLVLARALLQDPLIVIFDEATTSLDRESEQALREAVARWAGRRTIILISHGSLDGWPITRQIRMENGTIVSDEPVRPLTPV
ncbi:MAG: ABC transporter ATP-binding protein [Chloroflexota bacterium]|nr:ABC transporter ATP-binding protein/permease [Dehalococcoidia bacterium]MDW8252663.1 ABC transporter ATP-binding protein [Chloroflexota bacterium]